MSPESQNLLNPSLPHSTPVFPWVGRGRSRESPPPHTLFPGAANLGTDHVQLQTGSWTAGPVWDGAG
jgi:hypothetical protein